MSPGNFIEMVRLGDLAEEVTKGESIQWQGERYQDDGIPFIRTVNIVNGTLDISAVAFVSEATHNRMRRSQLKPGDVLLSIAGTLGRVGIVPPDLPVGNINQDVAIVRIRRPDVDPRYLVLALESPFVAKQIDRVGRGAGRIHLNLQQVRALELPLPPLEEQHRIAAILDKAKTIHRKRQHALQLTDDLLRSAFLEMFGDPSSNSEGWVVKTGKELFSDLTYGTSKKCSVVREQGYLPVLRIPNILRGQVLFGNLKYASLPDAEARALELRPGDLLFVRTNGNPELIGRCAVFDGGARTLFASYLIRGRVAELTECRPRFLQAVAGFPTYRARLVREARTTAGNYNISAAGLRRLPFICPPLPLQDKYLRFRQGVEALQRTGATESVSLEGLYGSLVGRAFCGELTRRDVTNDQGT